MVFEKYPHPFEIEKNWETSILAWPDEQRQQHPVSDKVLDIVKKSLMIKLLHVVPETRKISTSNYTILQNKRMRRCRVPPHQ